MQEALVQRYLGNKTNLADDIVRLVSSIARPGDIIFDAFSGSLAVSSALRSNGFRVASNDASHFSWLFSTAYFSVSQMPTPVWPIARKPKEALEAYWRRGLEHLTKPYTRTRDIPVAARRTDIFDHYCEQGAKSKFASSRGTSGRRRFFSAENAELIDRALSRVRYWYGAGRMNELTRCIATASLITAVEKISNTQGTFHDFPRDFIDSRALKTLTLRVPKANHFAGPKAAFIGKAADTLEVAAKVPPHKVLYLDPPYNFRQYSAYYFMLNLLSEYAEIPDLDGYFSDIQFVRGQNMSGDFKSSFCSRKTFVSSLRTLVERSSTEYVVLSYFNGRNHWSTNGADAGAKGRTIIEEFFAGPEFVKGSMECLPIQRTNYQSYGGHSARSVQEFLFVAQKLNHRHTRTRLAGGKRGATWNGKGSELTLNY